MKKLLYPIFLLFIFLDLSYSEEESNKIEITPTFKCSESGPSWFINSPEDIKMLLNKFSKVQKLESVPTILTGITPNSGFAICSNGKNGLPIWATIRGGIITINKAALSTSVDSKKIIKKGKYLDNCGLETWLARKTAEQKSDKFTKCVNFYRTIGILDKNKKLTEPLQNPILKNIYLNIHRLLINYYPKSTSHLFKNEIHFEYNTRLFILHIPNRMGDWQSPSVQRGPKKGGILGRIELREGQYGGAAEVPQTFNENYYIVLLMAPYSEKHNCHLYVHLYIPLRDSNPEFIKKFKALINNFEDKIKKHKK